MSLLKGFFVFLDSQSVWLTTTTIERISVNGSKYILDTRYRDYRINNHTDDCSLFLFALSTTNHSESAVKTYNIRHYNFVYMYLHLPTYRRILQTIQYSTNTYSIHKTCLDRSDPLEGLKRPPIEDILCCVGFIVLDWFVFVFDCCSCFRFN